MADEDNGDPVPENPLDRWIEPFFSESMLWPVLGVLVLCLVTLGASALLIALRERSMPAIAAVALVAGISAEPLWRDLRRRRLGPTSALLATLWLLSGLLAVVAHHYRLF